MFEKLIKDLNDKPEPEKVNIVISESPALNADLFRQKMAVIDNINDNELYSIIRGTINSIVNEIINHSYSEYIEAFTNPKFLTMFNQVVSTIGRPTHEIRLCCNKLAYDYFTMEAEKDAYIKQLLCILSKTVNRDVIPILMGIGIPENLAINMAMARYSSAKEIINVQRLNFVIINGPKELLTEQEIIYIYERLFDRVTPIFEGVMFDVINSDEEWVTDDIEEINSRISLAALILLNNMTSENIRKVLIDYSGEFTTLYSKKPNPVRFSLMALSEDYGRILAVAEALKMEGYIIP